MTSAVFIEQWLEYLRLGYLCRLPLCPCQVWDEDAMELFGAWHQVTGDGSDLHFPWFGNAPPTWEEWVEEGGG
jgi:hypothetical protein